MRSARALDAALLVAGLVVGAVFLREFVFLHDEGLTLQAAERIVAGEWPYRDFWWHYGPGQPLLLAGLSGLFGPSLLAWRLVWLATNAAVAVLAFRVVRNHAPVWVALAAWAATVLSMAIVRLPHPHPTVALLALGGILLAGRRPTGAGALAGVSALFRPELALPAIAGAAIAAGREGAVRAAGAGTAAALLVLLPFAVAAGVDEPWRSTFGFSFGVQGRARLPFPLDFPGGSPLEALHFYLPLVLVAGCALGAVAAAGWVRERELLALLPMTAAGLAYLLGRIDDFHLVPLVSFLPALLAGAAAATWAKTRPLSIALAAVLALVLVDGADRRIDRLTTAHVTAELPLEAADGVRVQLAEAEPLARVVRRVQDLTPNGEPVFVANPRHDLILSGNSLLYALLERPNATRYGVMQTGVQTSREVQAEIVEDLRAKRPVVVRWLAEGAISREDNASGRSSGVRLLDEYLGRAYEPDRRYGEYEVLRPRGGN